MKMVGEPERSIGQLVHDVEQNVLVPPGLRRRKNPRVLVQVADASAFQPEETRIVGIQLFGQTLRNSNNCQSRTVKECYI